MPRSSNAHAYVNAGFLALVDVENAFTITQKPTVVFGGIREDFIHANGTEEFLIGRSMSDHDMFEEVGSFCNPLKETEISGPCRPRHRAPASRGSCSQFIHLQEAARAWTLLQGNLQPDHIAF